MSGSLMNKGLSLTEKLNGQSRYRVDVHECSHFRRWRKTAAAM